MAEPDIADILACYRSGQISEVEMVKICRERPEVEEALLESSIAKDSELDDEDELAAARAIIFWVCVCACFWIILGGIYVLIVGA